MGWKKIQRFEKKGRKDINLLFKDELQKFLREDLLYGPEKGKQ